MRVCKPPSHTRAVEAATIAQTARHTRLHRAAARPTADRSFTWCALLDQQAADAARPRLSGAAHDHVHVRLAAAADERLQRAEVGSEPGRALVRGGETPRTGSKDADRSSTTSTKRLGKTMETISKMIIELAFWVY